MEHSTPVSPRKVLVLGGGFAAYRFVREIGTGSYKATLASPRNHFLFTPLLPSTTVGTLEFRSILEPLRGQDTAEFQLAAATVLDRERKIVSCVSPSTAARPTCLMTTC